MRDELKDYYDSELRYLNTLAQEFAQSYPKIASRLQIGADPPDPHVERLVEACAFLTARVRLKIDDEFPEITEALLEALYPHYIRPIPSMSVAEFHLDPEQGKLSTGLRIKPDSALYSRQVDRMRCKFRTCYDTTLWPVSVTEAGWTTPDRLDPPLRAPGRVAALRAEVRCFPDVQFAKLEWRFLRFYLHGESGLVHTLYELLCNNCAEILVRDPASRTRQLRLEPGALRPAGFGDEEGVLPYPRRSFLGYRLLQEYFSFPEKFFFLDLHGVEQWGAAGLQDRAEIVFLISPFERADRQQPLEVGVTAKTLRLNCCPVVNLFAHTCDPITVDHTRHEYDIIPDVRRRRALEIYSVTEVATANPQLPEIPPLYSFRHAQAQEQKQIFYYLRRRPAGSRAAQEPAAAAPGRGRDEGTEVALSLVDLSGRLAPALGEKLTVRCLCTNRDLPSRLPFGSEAGDFELEGMPVVKRVVALKKPTPTLRPPLGSGTLWRLVSQLSLNYLSLVSEGKEALQEILRLYNVTGSPHLEKQIQGIARLESRRHFARVFSENGISFVRGTRVEMLLDEERFVGAGVYLFASVLERFLGLYASLNSFSQLAVTTEQRKEGLCEWPPRAGQLILL
ncbi:MAG: type VI secretion system baseplate subunit TssF [Acidobacteria bacterium]|nr:type VI secretion system baseplate subunit TssF [Acidobacteriota bacterium]